MRNPSQAILLVVLMASLILPPGLPVASAAKVDPAARGSVKSILLVGDSLSIGLGQQIEQALAGRSDVRFAHLGKVSSGLANPAFFDWNAQLTAQVKAHHPDLVLIMVGANDDKPLPSGDGRSLPFGSRGWDRAYGDRLAKLHAIVRAENASAKVYFVGVPIMADKAFDTEMLHVNTVLASVARTLPDSAYIETRDVLADASGGFASQGRGPDGALVRLRAGDGVHVSGAGSKLLAARCLEAVSGAAGLPAGQVVAALNSQAVRPMGAAKPTAQPVRLAEATPATPKIASDAAKATPPAVQPARPAQVATAKPAPVVAPKPAAPAATPIGAYTVADGDTFWSVAKRLGVSPDALAAANGAVDPRRLSIGQSLAVPEGATRPAVTQVAAKPASGRTHTVADGDNFWSVARQHGVSVASLTQANPGVDPTRLRIGQSLALPTAGQPDGGAVRTAAKTAGHRYTVSDGDNFWSIAHRLGVDVAELKRANASVDPQKLQPGQVLSLPGGATLSEADGPTPGAQPVQVAGDAGLYPVAKGDTLWALARRFGVSFEAMVAVNGDLDPSRLRVGQLVTIPGATGQPVASADCLIFPVSPGDTFWGIARRFDVTVEALVAANPGVDPMRLREGQTLRVPSSLAAVAGPARPQEQAPSVPVVSGDAPLPLHSVAPGDTLWHLAKRFGVSVERILAENAGIDPLHLRVGQTLRLPGTVVSMAAR